MTPDFENTSQLTFHPPKERLQTNQKKHGTPEKLLLRRITTRELEMKTDNLQKKQHKRGYTREAVLNDDTNSHHLMIPGSEE
jgi:hypothetical protein